ncbi:Glycosyltransferase, GT2 family [Paraburkholderia unamae]|nr:Glycosyltransferase, GT2 family [Paraburkholderia unamae]
MPADAEFVGIRAEVAKTGGVHAISLIVTDFGRDDGFEFTLGSIGSQLIPPLELVIVTSSAARADRLAASARTAMGNRCAVSALSMQVDETACMCLNRAIAAIRSDFLAFVSVGDQLAPLALASMQCALNDSPDVAVVYSDEDWIDGTGVRKMPRFKTGWDPDAQFGFDLPGRLCVMNTAAVRNVGGLREGFATALYYDLHCRLTATLMGSAIRHVPAVLYHRQIRSQDFAQSEPALHVYQRGALRAASEAAAMLNGEPVQVVASPQAPFIQRVLWPLPESLPKVSILVPTRDRADLMETCVSGLLERTDYSNIELLILDNDSAEPQTHRYFERVMRDPRVRVLPMPGPFNYSAINNQGAAKATGDIIVLMNNDVEVLGDQWLREMVALALRPDVGCVGAKLLYGDRRVQHAGVLLQDGPLAMHVFRLAGAMDLGNDGQLAGLRSYLAVTAACLAVRRSVFEEVGGFDEANLRVAYNDIDLCLRVADAGYRNVCTPFSPLLHWESASRGMNDSPEKQARDRIELRIVGNRWRDRFEHDPFANPQLSYAWDRDVEFSGAAAAQRWIASAR